MEDDLKNKNATILLFGAGKSATVLIDYLSKATKVYNFCFIVADQKIPDFYQNAERVRFLTHSISNVSERQKLISDAHIVISLMPPALHIEIAKDCLLYGKHFINASYLSEEMEALRTDIITKKLIFITECGLDPGIDHISSITLLNSLKKSDNKIISYSSYTGGLVAPESDTNPWGYKITWNPKNVILAGQGTSRFIENNTLKLIPYHRLFSEVKQFDFPLYGQYEGYYNRDSSKYRALYAIPDCPTFIRGTLRKSGFCEAWNILVQLGMTDDGISISLPSNARYKDFTNVFLPKSNTDIETTFCQKMGISNKSDAFQKIKWLGLFSDIPIKTTTASPATILQQLIEEKWKTEPYDKDLIIMTHEIVYQTTENTTYRLQAHLICKGENNRHTAMAKTVGLPLALSALLILNKQFTESGLHIPTNPQLAKLLLAALQKEGIHFQEDIRKI